MNESMTTNDQRLGTVFNPKTIGEGIALAAIARTAGVWESMSS